MVIFFFQSSQRKYLKNNLVVDQVCCCGKKKKSNIPESNELKKFLLNMDISLNVSKLVFLFIT